MNFLRLLFLASSGVKFTWCEGHSHEADLELPVHTNVSCKLVVLGEHDSSTWEPGER